MSRFGQIPMTALLDKRLTPRDITVIAALGIYTDKHGWCHPSYTTVGAILGISRQAVQRSVQNLERAGYLERQHRVDEGNKSQTSNLTRVMFDYMPPESEQREVEKRQAKKIVARPKTLQQDVAPPQRQVAPPLQQDVAAPATSEVAPPATPALHELSQVKIPSEGKKKEPPALPAGLSDQSWTEFKSHRKKIRAAMTPEAERRALAKLAKLEADGHDPEKIVDRAIIQGWKGLFENEETLKQPPLGGNYASSRGSSAPRSAVDRVRAANERRRLERERTIEGEFRAVG